LIFLKKAVFYPFFSKKYAPNLPVFRHLKKTSKKYEIFFEKRLTNEK